jgi:hypothetical protein
VVSFAAALEPVAGWPLTIVAGAHGQGIWPRAGRRFAASLVRHWSEDNGERSGGDGLPGLRVLAGRDNGIGSAFGDRIMALAGVVGAVGGHRTDLFAKRYLAGQIGQDRCVTDMAPGNLDSADLQRFLINPEMDLAPDPPLGTAMPAGVPLAVALNLDAARHCPRSDGGQCLVVDQQV